MRTSAVDRGIESLIEPIHADRANLDWPPASIDLLWSEGAAYAIGFANALQCWKPLMAPGGVMVISEMSYFVDPAPESLASMMQNIYPEIKTEAANQDLIRDRGFTLLETSRLPSQAWWDNYYGPLRGNIELQRDSSDPVMQQVIKDTEAEMDFFRDNGDLCGYSFYVMQVDMENRSET